MITQIYSDIHFLSIKNAVYNDISSIRIKTRRNQCKGNSTQYHTAHTYKTPKALCVHPKNMMNPPDGFCTHLFLYLSIILIFSGLFIHMLSRIIKFKLKWLKVPTAYFTNKCRTRREKPKSEKLIWKARNNPPKDQQNHNLCLFRNIKG